MKNLNVALTYNQIPSDIQPGMDNSDNVPGTVVIDYDDTYAEWDTSETINAIKDALSINHNVTLIEADKDAYDKLKRLAPDIVFNVAEGKNGISREAQIPAMLDMLEIPYTGSDPLTLSICLDKARTKEILSYYKIPTPKFFRITSLSDLDFFNLSFPVIVKPVGEGSSKGIFNGSIIEHSSQLTETIEKALTNYRQDLIIEEYLPGREFTVAVMGNGSKAFTLPIVEMDFGDLPDELKPIYSFEAKWLFDSPEHPLNIFTCPANITDDLANEISDNVLKAYKVLNCKDWSRIDVRLDKNNIPNIIEVNPLPGVLPDPKNNSCYPKAARTYGLDYNEMINKVFNFALERHGLL